ncbi:uncharacterized protein BO88DRAFT_126005 [Aspergillus vadensis CBS 113365]|uniref:Uncharacterized protein n=1 Tax=Aspergillus vadensis (strain CBS 113365 / IMI 142717 / IBT 24658) TaxID=1448311 RepID=A0A319B0N6_ASPVC|nr:hypothetical protein BO88DRAFT_126005 [Aspergillus vadensis CBS 113365]PYH66187.1 hypothetical protein BO88DRAFT_126005 [Aspergillus vadensis CBS 113365]
MGEKGRDDEVEEGGEGRGKRGAKRRKLIYLSGLDFSMVFVVMGLGNWGLWEFVPAFVFCG